MVIKIQIKGYNLELETTEKLFSPSKVDPGTLAMLSCVEFSGNQKVLDLGCGYGVVGITAAKIVGAENVYMVDIDPEAVDLSLKNARLNNVEGVHVIESDAYDRLDESGFDLILCNPPYHVDFSVPKKFIEKGFNRLKTGGKLFMVTKRKDWYKNKLISVFGGVRIHEVNGYYVFEAERKTRNYVKKLR